MRLVLTSIFLFQLVIRASSQQQSQETCDALSAATSSPQLSECLTNTPTCTAVVCEVPNFGVTLTLMLLPCRAPPAVQVVAMDDDTGDEVANVIVDETRTITVSGQSVTVTFDQVEGGIQLQADVLILGFPTNLIPNTMIPIDTSSCQGTIEAVQPTATLAEPSSTPPTTLPSMTPTATIPTATLHTEPPSGSFETTCEALKDVVASLEMLDGNALAMCSTNGQTDCDAIVCSSVLGTITVTIMSCEEPPAVEFEFVTPNGDVDTRVFTSSATTSSNPVAGLLVLDITLDQFPEAIGLQITAQLVGSSEQALPIVQYTVIHLEKDKCDDRDGEVGGEVGGGPGEGSSGEAPGASGAVVAALLSLPLLVAALLN